MRLHADQSIGDLEFLKKAYNTAKGQVFDVDAKEMKWRIAVNLFKDFFVTKMLQKN